MAIASVLQNTFKEELLGGYHSFNAAGDTPAGSAFKIALYTSSEYCISCSSGTDALLMSLMAAEIGPGDAVFSSPFTFIATAEVIQLLGAKPVFIDIQEDTFNIDPNLLTEAVDECQNNGKLYPKAVIPVNIFGLPADYGAIEDLGKENNLFVKDS